MFIILKLPPFALPLLEVKVASWIKKFTDEGVAVALKEDWSITSIGVTLTTLLVKVQDVNWKVYPSRTFKYRIWLISAVVGADESNPLLVKTQVAHVKVLTYMKNKAFAFLTIF